MNFLDAHIIVHKYGEALGNNHPQKYDLMFRPYSDYGYDFNKQVIIDAFKLFYSHMILFNTRTQKEFEQYQLCLQSLDTFIPDSDMERVRKAAKIVMDKRLFSKILNASAREYAQKELDQFMHNALPPYSWQEQIDTFLTSIIQYKASWLKQYQAAEHTSNTFWEYVNKYCIAAYRFSNIQIGENDLLFFAPFDQLRADLAANRYPELLSPYADYILNSK